MSRLLIKADMVHVGDDVGLQPEDQPANEEPAPGVAVRRIAAPLAKLAMHVVGQVMPAGELVTNPEPVPPRFTVRLAVLPGQMTLAVIFPVTIAPAEEILLGALLFVVTVAQMRALPQASPVAVNRPVELTVTIWGVFDVQLA
jgi:hypothetical protein